MSPGEKRPVESTREAGPAPVFSVIVPVFNRAGVVRETLDSVAAQTWRPIELIVVDDGSTDGSVAVVEAFAAERAAAEFRILILRQANAGVCAARNAGIAAATGEYVQYLDSDDLIHPARLRRLAGAFAAEGCDFIITGFEGFLTASGEIIERNPGPKGQSLHDSALTASFWGNSLRGAYTRNLVDRMGPWDVGFDCFEDREYTERALFMAERPFVIHEILASARRDGKGKLSGKFLSRDGRALRIESEARLLRGALASGKVSDRALAVFASRMYGLGIRSYERGWIGHGRRCGAIAEAAEARLDAKGRRRRLVWRTGIAGSWIYKAAGALKAARAPKAD